MLSYISLSPTAGAQQMAQPAPDFQRSRLIAALSSRIGIPEARALIADYAEQPLVLIFMSVLGVLQETLAAPLSETAVQSVDALIQKASSTYDVGIVTMAEGDCGPAVAQLPFGRHVIGTVVQEKRAVQCLALDERFKRLSLAASAVEAPSKGEAIQRWLHEHTHVKVHNLVVLQPQENTIRAKFPRNFVQLDTLFSASHVDPALRILHDRAFAPEAPALFLKYQLVESYDEVVALAAYLNRRQPAVARTNEKRLDHYQDEYRLNRFLNKVQRLLEESFNKLSPADAEILFEMLISIVKSECDTLKSIQALLLYFCRCTRPVPSSISFHLRAFRLFEALLEWQDLSAPELDAILWALPYIMNHREFHLQLQRKVVEYIGNHSHNDEFARRQQLFKCITFENIHEECRKAALQFLLAPLRELRPFGIQDKCDLIYAFKNNIYLVPHVGIACKQEVVETLISLLYRPKENVEVREMAATSLAVAIWYMATVEPAWTQVQARVLGVLYPMVAAHRDDNEEKIQYKIADELFCGITWNDTWKAARQQLLPLFYALLESNKTALLIKEVLAKCMPKADEYIIPRTQTAIDLFFYMVTKLEDRTLPQLLQKSYLRHIVSCYLHSETRDLIRQREPNLGLLSHFHALIKDRAEFSETFEEAFQTLQAENSKLAAKKGKTSHVNGYDVDLV